MASGIQVKDECKTVYDELKIGHKHGYIMYKISEDNKFIEVDCIGDKNASYDEFCEKLIEAGKKGEGRYAVIDCHYCEGKASKIIFIMWLCDNTVKIKQKMMYSSSKKAIMEKLQVPREIQCNDIDDFAWGCLVEKCQSKYD